MIGRVNSAALAAGLGAFALTMPAAQAQSTAQGSVQQQVEELRRLIEQQQKTIGELQSRVQELQGSQEAVAKQVEQQGEDVRKNVVDKPLIVSTNPKIKVTLGGQVNRLLNFANDGKNTKAYFVDNNYSVSRLLLTGRGQVTDDFSVGTNIELGLSPNNSNDVSQFNEESGDKFEERKVEALFKSNEFGQVLFGKGDPATKDITRLDLSGTDALAYAATGDVAGGLFFLTKDGNDSSGIQIKQVFTDFDSGRQNRVRYDTPAFYGVSAAASYSADQKWGGALRWAGTGYGIKGVAGFGVQNPNNAGDKNVYSGSASAVHEATGLSLTYSTAYYDKDEGTGELQYIKAGWQHEFFDIGATAFSVDFGFNKDAPNNDDDGKTVGLVALQNIKQYGTELFVGVRGYDLDQGNGPDTSTIYVGTFGTRIKF